MMYIDLIKKDNKWLFILLLTLCCSCLRRSSTARTFIPSAPPQHLDFILPSMEDDDDESPLQVIWKDKANTTKNIPLGSPQIIKSRDSKQFILIAIPLDQNDNVLDIQSAIAPQTRWLYMIPAPYKILRSKQVTNRDAKQVKGTYMGTSSDENFKWGDDYTLRLIEKSYQLVILCSTRKPRRNFFYNPIQGKKQSPPTTTRIATMSFNLCDNNVQINATAFWEIASVDLKNSKKSTYTPGFFFSTLTITKKAKKKATHKRQAKKGAPLNTLIRYTKVHKKTKALIGLLLCLFAYLGKLVYDQQISVRSRTQKHNSWDHLFPSWWRL